MNVVLLMRYREYITTCVIPHTRYCTCDTRNMEMHALCKIACFMQ